MIITQRMETSSEFGVSSGNHCTSCDLVIISKNSWKELDHKNFNLALFYVLLVGYIVYTSNVDSESTETGNAQPASRDLTSKPRRGHIQY